MIGILVTTYNRPKALERSLPQIAALGAPILVVDDASNPVDRWGNEMLCDQFGAMHLLLPENRGLAASLNIGVSYWLADKSIEWISYFQDDVDVHPRTLGILSRLHKCSPILTGHDAGEHPAHRLKTLDGVNVKQKWSCRATHIHAAAAFWREFLPIPTFQLGAPKRVGTGRGVGSNVDWWIVRDSPRSCKNTRRPILCVPGLVRTFSLKAEDSCWNNAQAPEPPLGEYA